MANSAFEASLTPLQKVVYETDQLNVELREKMRMVSFRMGFFVGQDRYLRELRKIAELQAAHGVA
jgi:hypothetical protein